MTAQAAQKPRIAITMGDPAGIGPEILVKALADPAVAALARWIVIGDRQVLRWAEALTGLRPPAEEPVEIVDPNESTPTRFTIGRISAEAGRAALSYVRAATELCLKGRATAMVTGPVNKEAVTLSGERFTGHTEYIAGLCG